MVKDHYIFKSKFILFSLAIILFIALLARLSLLNQTHPNALLGDQSVYYTMSKGISEAIKSTFSNQKITSKSLGRAYSQGKFQPLYPVILSSAFLFENSEYAARLVSLFLWSLVFPLLFFLSKPLFGIWASLIGCLILAIAPSWIFFSISLWSEALFVPLIYIGALLFYQATLQEEKQTFYIYLLLSGISIGLACITRSQGVAFILVGAVFLFINVSGIYRKFASSIFFILVAILTILPHSFVLSKAEGKPTFITTTLGAALAISLDPSSRSELVQAFNSKSTEMSERQDSVDETLQSAVRNTNFINYLAEIPDKLYRLFSGPPQGWRNYFMGAYDVWADSLIFKLSVFERGILLYASIGGLISLIFLYGNFRNFTFFVGIVAGFVAIVLIHPTHGRYSLGLYPILFAAASSSFGKLIYSSTITQKALALMLGATLSILFQPPLAKSPSTSFANALTLRSMGASKISVIDRLSISCIKCKNPTKIKIASGYSKKINSEVICDTSKNAMSSFFKINRWFKSNPQTISTARNMSEFTLQPGELSEFVITIHYREPNKNICFEVDANGQSIELFELANGKAYDTWIKINSEAEIATRSIFVRDRIIKP